MLSYQEPFSPREEEVYQQLLTGKSIKEIAETLFVAPSTIRTHTMKIYKKKQVNSRLELLALKIEELKKQHDWEADRTGKTNDTVFYW